MHKKDAYQVITDRICELLEKGEIPWQKPWNAGAEMPQIIFSAKSLTKFNMGKLAIAGLPFSL